MGIHSIIIISFILHSSFPPYHAFADLEVDFRLGGAGAAIGDDTEACPPPQSPPPLPICPPPPPPPLLPQPTFESERLKLVYPIIQNFKSRVKHDPLGVTRTWVGGDICGSYRGFTCDVVPDYNEKALSGVNFNGFLFAGPELHLHSFIDKLPDISSFHANSNNFTGKIPRGIHKLRYLYELDLSNNKFVGEFPDQVLCATQLVFLDLRYNMFSGVIPAGLFELDLKALLINNNRWTQELPDFSSTPSLYLTFANNNFTGKVNMRTNLIIGSTRRNDLFAIDNKGTIPSSIGQASMTLVEVVLSNNSLHGCLPNEIGMLENAKVFDVGTNQLTGPIPYSLSCMENLKYLNLGRNRFCGTFPDSVCTLPAVVNLTLSFNYFTHVGPRCRELIKSEVLDLRMNCVRDLPDQRPSKECAVFYQKPTPCEDDDEESKFKSMLDIPCNKTYLTAQPGSHNRMPSAGSDSLPVSYRVLRPHHL